MQAVTVRSADPADIPEMARLWYEKMVLQQQFDRRFALLPDGQVRWMAEVANWLANSDCAIYVAERGGDVVGFIIAWVKAGPPGLSPEQIGVITDMVIDAHGQQGGAGRLLLQPVREWLAAHGISHLIAHVPRRQAVEQAFWRALGATEWLDSLWMKL
ncbi:MAG: GNAT family N-acetyltransferase [candidate division KSB1 bacterium]|nr:GNAT family N-acetyltransferase [candidate division KSB1 bacterium]